MTRAVVSAVIVGMPILCVPPWIHVEPLDPFFDHTRYGDLDRHAPIWNPPFSEAVALHQIPKSPVVIDRSRLAREWLMGALVLYSILTLVAVAADRTVEQAEARRMTLVKVAPLVALLLPVPPAGVLAFLSCEDLTDENHGLWNIFPILIYWGVLSALTLLVLWLGSVVLRRVRPAQRVA